MCDFNLLEVAVSVSFPTTMKALSSTTACLTLALASTICIMKPVYKTASTKHKTDFILFPNLKIVNI